MTTTLPELSPQKLNHAHLLNTLTPLIGLVFVFGFFTVLSLILPNAFLFARVENLAVIVKTFSIVGIASIGMTLVIVSGGIDLSVGSVMGLTTVVIAQLLLKGCSATVAALGGITAAATCGMVIGLLVTKLKLPPFVVTLGLWGALRGVAELFAGNREVDPPTRPTFSWDWKDTWLKGLVYDVPPERAWMLLPVGVWLTLILALLVAAMLRYTRTGRHIFAIGSNEQTARLCGVRVDVTKVLIYIAGSVFAGLAGLLEFSKTSHGSATAGQGAELNVIAAVVIGGGSLSGGQGSVFRSLIGAMIITMITNGCNQLDWPNSIQKLAAGGIIIFAVALDRLLHRAK